MLGTTFITTINGENHEYAEFCWKIGNVYAQQGALDRAIEEYGQAIKFYPGYTQAYYDRGRVHLKKGEYDLAILDLGEAIQLSRNDDKSSIASALRLRGHAHLYRGQASGNGELAISDFEAAINDLDGAIRLDPNCVEGFGDFYNLGFAYACKGEHDQAIRNYRTAIKLKPDFAEAYHGIGVAYNELREYHHAIRKFDKAIKMKPEYALAFHNRAVAYWELKDYVRATKDVNKAIELDPHLAAAFQLRSYAKGMVGDIKGANDDARRADQLRKLSGKSGG
jgi:tetratricopeptide (TPR) repeat protein